MEANDQRILDAMKVIKLECKKKRQDPFLKSGCGDSCPYHELCTGRKAPEKWNI